MLEHGAYNMLLDIFYGDEEPLPDEPGAVYRLVGAITPEEQSAVDKVLARYWKQTPEGWVNARAEREIAAFQEKSTKARASANARWNASSYRNANASSVADARDDAIQDPRSTSQDPLAKIQDPELVGATPPVAQTRPSRADIEDIFEFWKATMGHQRANLDDKRRKVIRDALKAGYTPDDCRSAIRGCSVTPHNMGENDRGQRYDGLHVIFRPTNIDRFIANANTPPAARRRESMIEMGKRLIEEREGIGRTYEHEDH